MKASAPSPVSTGRRAGPSRLLACAIVIPALVLLGYLLLVSYDVRDWTWFSLLLLASVGLIAFLACPNLFSITDRESMHGERTAPVRRNELQEKVVGAAKASAPTRAEPKAPHSTA